MRSSKRFRHAAALLLAVGATRAVCADAPAAASLCTTAENVFFACHVGNKQVSLCAARGAGEPAALTYRYGTPAKVEYEYTATAANGKRFSGFVAPLSPRALVSQIWFTSGSTEYLLTSCQGGDCPHGAALTVLRGDRILLNGRCSTGADDKPWFSRELVEFGSDTDDSRSKTELLRIDPTDHPLGKIYRVTPRPDQ